MRWLFRGDGLGVWMFKVWEDGLVFESGIFKGMVIIRRSVFVLICCGCVMVCFGCEGV